MGTMAQTSDFDAQGDDVSSVTLSLRPSPEQNQTDISNKQNFACCEPMTFGESTLLGGSIRRSQKMKSGDTYLDENNSTAPQIRCGEPNEMIDSLFSSSVKELSVAWKPEWLADFSDFYAIEQVLVRTLTEPSTGGRGSRDGSRNAGNLGIPVAGTYPKEHRQPNETGSETTDSRSDLDDETNSIEDTADFTDGTMNELIELQSLDSSTVLGERMTEFLEEQKSRCNVLNRESQTLCWGNKITAGDYQSRESTSSALRHIPSDGTSDVDLLQVSSVEPEQSSMIPVNDEAANKNLKQKKPKVQTKIKMECDASETSTDDTFSPLVFRDYLSRWHSDVSTQSSFEPVMTDVNSQKFMHSQSTADGRSQIPNTLPKNTARHEKHFILQKQAKNTSARNKGRKDAIPLKRNAKTISTDGQNAQKHTLYKRMDEGRQDKDTSVFNLANRPTNENNASPIERDNSTSSLRQMFRLRKQHRKTRSCDSFSSAETSSKTNGIRSSTPKPVPIFLALLADDSILQRAIPKATSPLPTEESRIPDILPGRTSPKTRDVSVASEVGVLGDDDDSAAETESTNSDPEEVKERLAESATSRKALQQNEDSTRAAIGSTFNKIIFPSDMNGKQHHTYVATNTKIPDPVSIHSRKSVRFSHMECMAENDSKNDEYSRSFQSEASSFSNLSKGSFLLFSADNVINCSANIDSEL